MATRTWRASTAPSAPAATMSACARPIRAWRLAALGMSWLKPTLPMVISSVPNRPAGGPETGKLSRPTASLGSGRAPAALAEALAASTCRAAARSAGALAAAASRLWA